MLLICITFYLRRNHIPDVIQQESLFDDCYSKTKPKKFFKRTKLFFPELKYLNIIIQMKRGLREKLWIKYKFSSSFQKESGCIEIEQWVSTATPKHPRDERFSRQVCIGTSFLTSYFAWVTFQVHIILGAPGPLFILVQTCTKIVNSETERGR